MDDLTNVWREVSDWPPERRLALATRLLQSLQQDERPAVSDERREALRKLIGIWKSEQPPNDEQSERILEQERKKKYG